MTNIRYIGAVAATTVGLFVSSHTMAQDDLEALLGDLEKETTAASQQDADQKPEVQQQAEAPAVAKEPEAQQVGAPAVVEEPKVAAEESSAAPAEQVQAPQELAKVVSADSQPSATGIDKETLNLLEALKDEVAALPEPQSAQESPVAESSAAKTASAKNAPAAESAPKAPSFEIAEGPNKEFLENIFVAEKQRREAFDIQAVREISVARKAMLSEDYVLAIRSYQNAKQYLNDSVKTKSLRVECEQGIAEGLYLYAIKEDKLGRREKALLLLEKAVDRRHPKARRKLESWRNQDDPDAYKTDISEIKHRQNDDDYKKMREEQRKRLRRARHLLATREMQKALDECEYVLKFDPYNQEALNVRNSILKKRKVILDQERKVTRKGMIDDVDEKWRPVYAPNARQLEEVEAKTIRTSLAGEAEKSPEQILTKRMQDMILPTVEFKPPATISDAVDYFRDAARDFDNPEIPIEKRGFGMYLRTPKPMYAQAATEDGGSDDFSDDGNSNAAATPQNGLPMIPNISVNNISFYEALKLVCDSVGYKFKVQGSVVIVMEKSMTSDEMITRSYPVLASFLDKMSTASEEIRDMQSAGAFGANAPKGDEEPSQQQDWKGFFKMMGVEWPEGSSIFYLKTLGKLRVKNTRENLVDFEDALNELNVDQRLIEIETRFVEVCQDDLNSLGFEWLLNSDYSLGLGNKLGKVLGVKGGKWGEESSMHQVVNETSMTTTTKPPAAPAPGAGPSISNQGSIKETVTQSSTSSTIFGGAGNRWSQNSGGGRNVGINAINGTDYSNGNRYLSTVGNHISGQSNSHNDQFMRVNAFLGNADLSMILHMLSQRSDTDLLSSPKVLTRPGEEAIIKVVTEFIYPTDYDVQLSSSSGSSGGYGSSSSSSSVMAIVEPQSFTMREVGVILDVTPTLTDDGNLIDLELDTQVVDEPTWKNYGMKIPYSGNTSLESFEGIGDIFGGLASIFGALGAAGQEALQEMAKPILASTTETATTALSNLSSQDGNIEYYDVPMEQPFFHTRSINSKVSVYPGATIVMGGLITEARKAMDDKIPFLGDIPFIGRLFRSHSEFTSKRNLLIFVTTRLVDTRGREVQIGSSEVTDAPVKPAVSGVEE